VEDQFDVRALAASVLGPADDAAGVSGHVRVCGATMAAAGHAAR